jgi:hypothetical protein
LSWLESAFQQKCPLRQKTRPTSKCYGRVRCGGAHL